VIQLNPGIYSWLEGRGGIGAFEYLLDF
jgi:hypothetical protein